MIDKKIEIVSSTRLPVDEQLQIKRCRYMPKDIKKSEVRRLPRISIVTGTHGDELEGQYVCYELANMIKKSPESLKGIVDIYPATNPLGIDSITRGIPNFDLDMNRIFPGNKEGTMIEYNAMQLIDSLDGSDLVIDIHASNIFLRELPQARINEIFKDDLLPFAKLLNLDFLWVHGAATVLEATLCHSLNQIGTKCIVIEAGVGMRITDEYCRQITDGILNVMKELGIWDGAVSFRDGKHIYYSNEKHEVNFLNSNRSGIFHSVIAHCTQVKEGDIIGEILDPLEGEVKEFIKSPCKGLVFTLREYPVVYTGSLIARILEGDFI